MFKDYFLHLFEDYIYDFRHMPRDTYFSWIKVFRTPIRLLLITKVAIPPSIVPSAQGEDAFMLRAVVHRTTKEVHDYCSQY
jgi:hypothetical protein